MPAKKVNVKRGTPKPAGVYKTECDKCSASIANGDTIWSALAGDKIVGWCAKHLKTSRTRRKKT